MKERTRKGKKMKVLMDLTNEKRKRCTQTERKNERYLQMERKKEARNRERIRSKKEVPLNKE